MASEMVKRVVPVQLSDLYNLFNLDALDLTILHCFIL
jgi:hypothetical protein